MDHIDLTDREWQIFDRLLQVLRHFNLQTQLRVTGGWVRDKLLGEESNDIDIALDNMLGKEFCEKSKHLETAKMGLFDVWIDFVNLRAEDYCENSRIPTMRFGTAEEDAYRRDLTINSLFYNINTSSVEDFTQRGIADLISGKIITPLHPKQTFLDDPLRVLRAIRFGARFGFLLDEELKVAAVDEDVKTAIANKITRDRIACEIDLMISGHDPVEAMTHIVELQLFWTVFSLPPVVEPSIPKGIERLCVTSMDSAWRLLQLIGSSSFPNEQRRLYLYAALLLPLRNTVYKDKKGKEIPAANHIFRTSCKLNHKKDGRRLESLHLAAKQFVSLIPLIISVENLLILEVDGETGPNSNVQLTPECRIDSGLLLRTVKKLWRASLLLALLVYPEDIAASTNKDTELNEHEQRALLYNKVEKAILEMGLEQVWELKPLLNGNEIMNILQIESGGEIVKDWKEELLVWQLEHPSGSTEESIDYMKSKRARTKYANGYCRKMGRGKRYPDPSTCRSRHGMTRIN